MALVQPYVFRLFFNSEDEASDAKDQLLNSRIYSDSIKTVNKDDPAKWKVIFAELDMITAKKAVMKLNPQPRAADYFDPKDEWGSVFKPVL